MINTASEEALLAQMAAKYERQEPVLFYFYKPHAIFTKYDLAQVELPPCTKEEHEAKVDSRQGGLLPIRTTSLIKIFNPKFKDNAPEAYSLLKNFNYTTDDQIEMLGMLDQGKTVEEAAQAWIDAHPDTLEGVARPVV